jgi:hypothetical protein
LKTIWKRVVPLLLVMPGLAIPAAAEREVLLQAAEKAIDTLGREDGYFGNAELERVHKALQALGASKQSGDADELVLALNRAAEAALPESRMQIAAVIREMPMPDPQAAAGDSLTQQLRATRLDQLKAGMLPAVGKATQGVHLAEKYNDVARRASALGLVDQRDASLDEYVARQALDGLFKVMGKEEAALRAGKQ